MCSDLCNVIPSQAAVNSQTYFVNTQCIVYLACKLKATKLVENKKNS